MQRRETFLNMKDCKRYEVFCKIASSSLTNQQRADALNISVRQYSRIKKRAREEGINGLAHRTRGKPSRRKLSQEVKDQIIELAKTKYLNFGASLLTEKLHLHEPSALHVSRETVRKILIEAHLHRARTKKTTYRVYRERRSCYGELLQVDGCIHDWFGTGEKCWLISCIDDATGKIWLRYARAESTITLMQTMKEYFLLFGCPLALYVDRDSIYITSRQPSIEEQLREQSPATQFTRAMNELGIKVICANSPQAKG